MLDQNYRSSPSILAVANAVISSGAAAPCAVVCGDPSAPSPETVTADIVGTSLSRRKLWTTSTIVRALF
jgi:superfamily I DNA/RNA helicase